MRERIRWLCLMLVHLFGGVCFSVVKNHDAKLKILEVWVAIAARVPFGKPEAVQ